MEHISDWWFGTVLIFPYIGNNTPNLLIFFRGVETTNQIYIYIYNYMYMIVSVYVSKIINNGDYTYRMGSGIYTCSQAMFAGL